MAGYHVSEIPKYAYGTAEKIQEEILELLDAEQQDCKVMCLVELSDILGAIEGYLTKNFSGITLEDLLKMKDITKRAFKEGTRK